MPNLLNRLSRRLSYPLRKKYIKPGGELSRVPLEIQLLILAFLVEDLRVSINALLFSLKCTRIDDAEALEDAVSPQRRDLYHAALVSRSWMHAVVPLLYSHPILTSPTEFRLFRRSVTYAPILATLVKEMSIVVSRASYPSSRSIRRRGEQDFYDSDDSLWPDVSFILHACPSLESVSLRSTVTSARSITSNFLPFGESTTIHSTLKSLSIRGPIYAHCSGMRVSFANLEVLFLNWFEFGHQFRLPTFPRVHTLKLRHTAGLAYSDHDPYSLPINLDDFPSLKSLYLYFNSPWYPPNRAQEKSNLPVSQLEKLHLVGPVEVELFQPLSEAGVLSQLQHLVLGTITEPHHLLSKWRFPSALRSLEFIIDLFEQFAICTLGVLLECLIYNEVYRREDMSQLLRVVVNVHWERENTLTAYMEEHVDDIMETIRELCESIKVDITFNVVGAVYEFYLVCRYLHALFMMQMPRIGYYILETSCPLSSREFDISLYREFARRPCRHFRK